MERHADDKHITTRQRRCWWHNHSHIIIIIRIKKQSTTAKENNLNKHDMLFIMPMIIHMIMHIKPIGITIGTIMCIIIRHITVKIGIRHSTTTK